MENVIEYLPYYCICNVYNNTYKKGDCYNLQLKKSWRYVEVEVVFKAK